MKYIVRSTRIIVAIGSLSSIVMGALLFIAAAVELGRTIIRLPATGLGSHAVTKDLVIAAVEHADTVLIAAALIIIGVGLYGLFVDQIARLPHWLEIGSLQDLKDKLVSVVVAVLAVNFFTQVVNWDGTSGILYLGAGIGLVVYALAAFHGRHGDGKAGEEQHVKPQPGRH